jgi:hypothetical protein
MLERRRLRGAIKKIKSINRIPKRFSFFFKDYYFPVGYSSFIQPTLPHPCFHPNMFLFVERDNHGYFYFLGIISLLYGVFGVISREFIIR